MTEHHIIYGLFDPITKNLHYIGYTSNKEKRYNDHLYKKSGSKEKRIWIAHLIKQGLHPIMEVIEEHLSPEDLPEAEIFWYEYLKMLGAELYNDSHFIGGGSMKGRLHTEETKIKLRIKRKGKTPMKGKHHSEKSKQKISEANVGRPSPNKNKSPTEETRNKISAALTGKISSRSGKTWKMMDGKRIWIEVLPTPEGHKRCNVCGETRPVEEFYFTNATHTKRKGTCKICS